MVKKCSSVNKILYKSINLYNTHMDLIKADLHMHSRTGSDGALYAQELAYLLHELWLEYASLTDHDSVLWVELIREFLLQIGSNVKIIPWLEITTHYNQKTLHLLAYGIDPNSTELTDFLVRQKNARRDRAVQIVERLNVMLKNEWLRSIPLEDILALEWEWPITRPDIANYLLENGYVQNFQDAFTRWLVQCDVQLQSMDIYDTTRFVYELWWTPIIAHTFAPWISLNTVARDMSERVRLLMELKANWLQWVEVYYQWHENDPTVSEKIALADSLWLLVTGGSDFHGGDKWAAPLPWWTEIPRWRFMRLLEWIMR